jgi:hypothetical protein
MLTQKDSPPVVNHDCRCVADQRPAVGVEQVPQRACPIEEGELQHTACKLCARTQGRDREAKNDRAIVLFLVQSGLEVSWASGCT